MRPSLTNSPLNRRFTRVTAWMMLLAWLFVVSAGVANACLLEQRTHHPTGVAAYVGDHAAVNATHGEEPDATSGRDEPTASKAACRKVCDESPQSPVKQSSTPDVDPPTMAATLWSPWTTGVMHDPAHRYQLLRSHVPPPGPPLRLRYARLVL